MKIIRAFVLVLLMATHVHAESGHEHEADFLGVLIGMSAKIQELTGIKTQPALAASSGQTLSFSGRLVEDMDRTLEVTAKVKGVLKEYVLALGAFAAKDDVIARLLTAEGAVVDIKAPAQGVIAAQFIDENAELEADTVVVMLADLSVLALHADIYERDMAVVKSGQRALVRTAVHPGEVFEGSLDFISPRIDETSATLKVRVNVVNDRFLLKPGMFMQGEVLLDDNAGYLAVSADALQSIEGIEVVFRQEDEASFTPVRVESRPAAGGQMLIKGDVKPGDRIVTQGSFILKSKILEDEIAGGHCH